MNKIISGMFLYPGKVGGAENYLINLLKGIKTLERNFEFKIVVNEEETCFPSGFDLVKKKVILNRAIFDSFPFLFSKFDGKSIYFSPNYITPLHSHKNMNVVTVIHDLQYRHFPQYFSLKKRAWLNFSISNTLKNADRVVCISEFVKNDIIRVFGRKFEDKLVVIHNPIDLNRFEYPLMKINTQGKYVLSVCAHYPHKNLLVLIKAFKLFHKAYPDYKMILVGQLSNNLVSTDSGYGIELRKAIEGDDSINVTGYLSDEELGVMYAHCSFFVYPSLFEGFGMPPVEAMSLGKPVITTSCGSLKEVTLDKAIYVQDPLSKNDYLNCMLDVASNIDFYQNKYMSLKGEVVNAYSPSKIAQKYLTLFDEVS